MTDFAFLGVVAGLLGILAQTGAMFYWGGKMSANMTQLSEVTEDHEGRIRDLELS
jgi:hypothetical protein